MSELTLDAAGTGESALQERDSSADNASLAEAAISPQRLELFYLGQLALTGKEMDILLARGML